MLYRSTKSDRLSATLAEAISRGVAPDGGLYVPEHVPQLPRAFFNNMGAMTVAEIGFVVARLFVGDEVDAGVLKSLVEAAMADSSTALLAVDGLPISCFAPAAADSPRHAVVDARLQAALMSRLMRADAPAVDFIVDGDERDLDVAETLAADSRSRVFIVGPARCGRPLLTIGRTTVIEVAGTTADCRKLLTATLASLAGDATHRRIVSTASGAGIVALVSQAARLLFGVAKLTAKGVKISDIVVATDAGVTPDLPAAVMAMRMGLGIKRIVAVGPAKDINGLRSAIDGGEPLWGNVARALAIAGGSSALGKWVVTVTVGDDEPTADAMCRALKADIATGEAGLVIADAQGRTPKSAVKASERIRMRPDPAILRNFIKNKK